MPSVDAIVPTADPEEVYQRAIEAGLIVLRPDPLNCETSIPGLLAGVVTSNARFYVRNHFQIPDLDPSTWRLQVGGRVERPMTVSLPDLQDMRSQTLVALLECAGNGRSRLSPPVEGEQWGLGAVSTAEWTGVPLVEVLDRAGIKAEAREVLFRGADSGTVDGRPGVIRFERSLRLDQVRDSQALLAYAMNGDPLPIEHGYPLRVIVPGWYGVTSVKWLTEIELIDVAFNGYFQADRYFYEVNRGGQMVTEPLTLQRVRAVITEPGPDDVVERGDLAIRGAAWSGAAPIARVDVSVGGGPWLRARLVGTRNRHSWQRWELITRVDRPGTATLRARATDLAGGTQPEQPEWNRLGYGANAIHEVPIRLR